MNRICLKAELIHWPTSKITALGLGDLPNTPRHGLGDHDLAIPDTLHEVKACAHLPAAVWAWRVCMPIEITSKTWCHNCMKNRTYTVTFQTNFKTETFLTSNFFIRPLLLFLSGRPWILYRWGLSTAASQLEFFWRLKMTSIWAQRLLLTVIKLQSPHQDSNWFLCKYWKWRRNLQLHSHAFKLLSPSEDSVPLLPWL